MLIERSDNAKQLWQVVMPHIPAPDTRQFVLWASRFADEQFEQAIMRTCRRFSPEKVQRAEPAEVHRYVTGLLLNLEKEVSHDGRVGLIFNPAR